MGRKTYCMKEPANGAGRAAGGRRVIRALAVAVLALGLNPFVGASIAAEPSAGGPHAGDSVHGKALYEKYCHYCHGPKGRGDGPVGIAITPKPVDFTSDKRMLKSDKQLFSSISNGIRREKGGKEMAMPRWKGILSDNDIWDVLAYVRELQREGTKNPKKAEDPHATQGGKE
jgi:mono/diheme cytochrome c family protein